MDSIIDNEILGLDFIHGIVDVGERELLIAERDE